jgi:hypothetical protein
MHDLTDDEPCECELPGPYCCDVPGILAWLEQGRVPPGAGIERCDLCQRYASDAAAADALSELGLLQPVGPPVLHSRKEPTCPVSS